MTIPANLSEGRALSPKVPFAPPHPNGRAHPPGAPCSMVRLKNIVEINPRPAPLSDNTLVSFVPMKCVEEESGRFVSAGDKRVAEVKKGYTSFRDGDVIWAKVTPCMENGKAAVLTGLTNGFGYGSTEFFVLRPSAQLDLAYLLHFILQKSFRQKAAQHMTGAVGLRRVPKSFLEQQEIPLPPLSEQCPVVAEIEKQFTRLDAGAAALRRVQANLKRYRAAVLKAACEGRLVPTETELARKENRTFETGEQLLQRILAECRKNWPGRGKYKEPSALEVTKLPHLPKGWVWAILPQLGELNRGKSKHRPRDDMRLYEGPYPFIQTGDVRKSGGTIRDYSQTYSEFGLQQSRLWPEGTLCITIAANIAETGILTFKGCFPDSVVGFVHEGDPATTRYIEYFLRTAKEKLVLFAPATAQKNINLNILQKVAVPLPPLTEQKRIVAEVERHLSLIDELETTVTASLARATRLRQSILQKSFAGETALQSVAEPVQVKPASRPLNRHFARVILSAEIIHQLHAEPTFGRIKHQKIFHLCEHIAQLAEIEGQYHREAAGPLDNRLIYANEGELKRQQWYQEARRTSYGHIYAPLAKAGGHTKYLEGIWPEKLSVIRQLISLMRSWNTERCEIFSTTYAAWNDLLIWKREPTDEAILHEILHRWHESKRRISEDRWRKAISWVEKEGFSPAGFGKATLSDQ
ncbi:MAG: restriction endonuclease subunit S [Puniceicoccales bacterium]|jgi:type I restriction enzyme S subunit|nr:restriction endonuclease subunit S [Puniceicoccales bacterium]